MARSLYEIDHEIAELFDSETGEIGEEALLRLTELEMERDQKIEGVACAVKNLTAEAAMYKAEAKAFAERQKQAEATIARLKKWLVDATGGAKFSSPRALLTFRSTTSVEVDEGAELPRSYLRIKEVAEPDKVLLKQVLEQGYEVPGVHLIRSQSVTVK